MLTAFLVNSVVQVGDEVSIWPNMDSGGWLIGYPGIGGQKNPSNARHSVKLANVTFTVLNKSRAFAVGKLLEIDGFDPDLHDKIKVVWHYGDDHFKTTDGEDIEYAQEAYFVDMVAYI